MKKFLFTIVFIISVIASIAQSPSSFSYQAVIKDAQGGVVANQNISMQVGILQGSASGTNVFTEIHQVETNSYGLVSLQIGNGEIVSGNFTDIEWGTDVFFIQIAVDITGGTSYNEIGTMQLASVPYALYANDVLNKDDEDADPSNELQTLELSGSNLSLSDGNSITLPDADDSNEIQTLGLSGANLSITDGNSITLPDADDSNEIQSLGLSGNTLSITDGNSVNLSNYVSPWQKQGDNIYYNNGNVGVGINSPQARLEVKAAATSNIDDPLLQVINKTGDTVFAVYDGGVKISFDENAKGNIGGFAVSGRTTTKGDRDYFTVSKDSTRVYVDQSAKGNIGGFAVSGRTTTKSISAFMDLTPQNYFIGHSSGSAITTGIHNTFIGYESGKSTSVGSSNIFIGQESGMNNAEGIRNIFIGTSAGKENIGDAGSSTVGHDNIYIGTNAGRDIIEGEHNTLIGSYSGYVSTGTKSTFVGAFTGFAASGTDNVFLGVDAGRNNTAGEFNAFLGTTAGANNSGSRNTFVGQGAGYNNTGDDNVFIGHHAGSYASGSQKLYIENTTSNTPLIYGEFDNDYLKFNANVGINVDPSINYQLYVVENTENSDRPAIYATHDVTDNYGVGVKARSRYRAIWGEAVTADGYAYGIYGYAAGTGTGTRYGVFGYATGGTTNYAGYFSGNVTVTGTFANPSDKNLKKNIEPFKGALDKILQVNGVTYEWKTKSELEGIVPASNKKEENETRFNFPDGTQYGVIAQDVEKVMPELVQTDADGIKSVDYLKMVPVLIEAIKEQNKVIETLKESEAQLKSRLEEIEQKLKNE